MSKKIKWACPKCGAPPNDHGKGGADACRDELSRHSRDCAGFLCECEDSFTAESHGESADDPCESAVCHHCGWEGTFPVPAIDPKKLRGWKKTAWEAGWRPKS